MNTRQKLSTIGLGFLGAMIFTWVREVAIPPAFAKREAVVVGSAFHLVDEQGRLRAQLGFSKEGTPSFWLMDEKGTARINFGMYQDGSAFMGLQDRSGQMIQLMRSFGPNESPLLIFKRNGQDQMITGLNPAADTVPFLMSYEADRKRKVHFGKYEGP